MNLRTNIYNLNLVYDTILVSLPYDITIIFDINVATVNKIFCNFNSYYCSMISNLWKS